MFQIIALVPLIHDYLLSRYNHQYKLHLVCSKALAGIQTRDPNHDHRSEIDALDRSAMIPLLKNIYEFSMKDFTKKL